MFAEYVVFATKTKTTPVIIPPWDKLGKDRWVTKSVDIREVIAAGDIRWGSRDNPDVACSGEGAFLRSSRSTRATIRSSRGDVDAELFRQMLSHPVTYVVLNLAGLGERPILISSEEDPEQVITKFQEHMARDVVSAGHVEFDLEHGHTPVCSGSVQLGSWIKPYTVESRGEEDAELIQEFFVESLL